MWVYLWKPTARIPAEYQEVEYIQSSGDWTWTGQYIDLGLSIQSGHTWKVEADITYLNTGNQDERALFASYDWRNNHRLQLGVNAYDSTFRNNLWTVGNSWTATWTPNTVATNTRYTLVTATQTCNFTSSRWPRLFAQNEWSAYNDGAYKLYSFKVTIDDTLTRDVVPCYRIADGVIWLYDLVTDTFYVNQWVWAFTKWNNVAPQPAQNELKNAYIGEYYKIFTISWTEASSPSSFNPTWSDDATGLVAWSTAFDEFFNYSAVRLNTSWVETAEVKQTTPWQLDLSQLWTLTSGDNVMIKFPRLWIKMSKSGSTVTLSITDNPDAEADGFQYYAHSRWTLSSPIKKDALYLWAFKAYNSSNVLKSWSWQSPVAYITQQNCINYARANDGNTGSAGYDIIGFYQRQFINALYMMKYGNPNSQSVVWLWYTGWSAKVNTGGTVSQALATYWTSSSTQQVKLFWLEDWWGNIHEWVWWVYTDWSKNLYTQLSWYSGAVSGWESTWSTIQTTSWIDLSSIVWNNKVLFWPSATVNNWSYNTYYCDLVYVDTSRLAFAGGSWSHGSEAGAFHLDVSFVASGSDGRIGSRLMYL